jgi:hypothetical protein
VGPRSSALLIHHAIGSAFRKANEYTDPFQVAPATSGAHIHQFPQLGAYVSYGAAADLPSPGPTECGFVEHDK